MVSIGLMGSSLTGSHPTLSGRQRNPRGEGSKLRSDLLDAAIALMATQGTIEEISLRSVARRAGVSPTAVYRHFDDHLDLLRESIDQCWEHFDAVIAGAARDKDDPFDAFRVARDAHARFAVEHPGPYRILFSNRIHLDITDVEFPEVATGTAKLPAFQVLLELVTAILERNHDRRDPFFVTVQAYTSIHGTIDLFGSHPDTPWPEMQLLLDSLTTAFRLDPR